MSQRTGRLPGAWDGQSTTARDRQTVPGTKAGAQTKRLIVMLGLLAGIAGGLAAQAGETWYYRYVETVAADTGVRTRTPDYWWTKNMYVTFTRNSCYVSNDDGQQIDDATSQDFIPPGLSSGTRAVYQYQGEQNDRYAFMYHGRHSTQIGNIFNPVYAVSTNQQHYWYFSKDYNRLNMRIYYMQTDTFTFP
jgi:hypothetical protein